MSDSVIDQVIDITIKAQHTYWRLQPQTYILAYTITTQYNYSLHVTDTNLDGLIRTLHHGPSYSILQ